MERREREGPIGKKGKKGPNPDKAGMGWTESSEEGSVCGMYQDKDSTKQSTFASVNKMFSIRKDK